MKDNYINISLRIPEEKYEIVYSELMDYNFTGIEEKHDEIIITFKEQDWTSDIKNSMIESFVRFNIDFKFLEEKSIEDKNWNEEWEKNTKPIIVNDNISITPTWRKEDVDTKYKILIDPKMSFGTGEHTTTRLMCKFLEKNVKEGSKWIDAGTGTGVLAILSILLGAKECFAFDNNIWSIENAKENFELNRVSDKIELKQFDIDSQTIPEADGIVANLFLNLVLGSFSKFKEALLNKRGDLLVSGILKYDKDLVLQEADKEGFELIEELIEDEWIGFHFKLKGN